MLPGLVPKPWPSRMIDGKLVAADLPDFLVRELADYEDVPYDQG